MSSLSLLLLALVLSADPFWYRFWALAIPSSVQRRTPFWYWRSELWHIFDCRSAPKQVSSALFFLSFFSEINYQNFVKVGKNKIKLKESAPSAPTHFAISAQRSDSLSLLVLSVQEPPGLLPLLMPYSHSQYNSWGRCFYCNFSVLDNNKRVLALSFLSIATADEKI